MSVFALDSFHPEILRCRDCGCAVANVADLGQADEPPQQMTARQALRCWPGAADAWASGRPRLDSGTVGRGKGYRRRQPGLRPPGRGAMLSGMNTNTVIAGDCLDVLPTLPAGYADLIFADPPFNIGLDYPGYRDRLPRTAYLAFTDRWLTAAVRVLSPAGSLFVQIADEWAGHVQVRLDALGLAWRNRIIWRYAFGTHQSAKFGRDHQQVLYYVADPRRFTFDANAIRIPSDRQTKYRDKRANPVGRVPGDVWHFPRVCGTFKERRGHCCQTPEAILERIILACSAPGDLVLDPLCGTGTSLAVAARLGRRYLGVELSEATADLARRRVA
jgi:site-specific DNA-methyltransferase (adenine-specific)